MPLTRVRGLVREADGSPVGGAGIHAATSGSPAEPPRGLADSRQVGVSLADGTFVTEPVETEGLWLCAIPRDMAVATEAGWFHARWERLGEGASPGDTVNLTTAVATGDLALLRCIVRDEEGRPRRGVNCHADKCVRIYGEHGSSRTSDEGRIALRVVPGSRTVFAADTETHEGGTASVEAAPGSVHDLEILTRRWSPDRPFDIVVALAGTAGEALEGVTLMVCTEGGLVGEAVTDARGCATVKGLPGQLRAKYLEILPSSDRFPPGTSSIVVPTPVVGPSVAIRAVLTAAVEVRVVVRCTGAGWGRVRIVVADSHGHGQEWEESGASDRNDGELVSVMPGAVRVTASREGEGSRTIEAVVREGETDRVLVLEMGPPRGRG